MESSSLAKLVLKEGGRRSQTAQQSNRNGSTTKKVTAIRKSIQTKLRIQKSLDSLRGESVVSGLRNILMVENAADDDSNDGESADRRVLGGIIGSSTLLLIMVSVFSEEGWK